MGEDCITRHEHAEFSTRMDAENARLSHRITAVEESVKKIGDLTVEVKELAVSIKQMAAEIGKQSERLARIEAKPAKHWDTIVTGILGAIAGAIGAAIAAGIIR